MPRPHLVERLNEGLRLGHRLTLVSAPAGYGKTTLLSEWIDSLRRSASAQGWTVSWLSLDEDDNDPARFSSYLIAALSELVPQAGQEQPPANQAVFPEAITAA